MDIKKYFDRYLRERDFKLISYQDPDPDFFGNYYYDYSNGSLKLRLGSDRSFMYINVGDANKSGKWFDLPIVIAFINNDNELTKVISIETQIDYLEQNFPTISNLFSRSQGGITSDTLEILRHRRAKQMFSGTS